MDKQWIHQAAAQAGIAPDYINAEGQQLAVSLETQEKLLQALATGNNDLATHSEFPQVQVLRAGQAGSVKLPGQGEVHWTLTLEQGQVEQGQSLDAELPLPATLPLGYHQLDLQQAEQHWTCLLIVAPANCYQPAEVRKGKKLWGANVQLYTLRSQHNWGMGDFGDLNRLLPLLAQRGADFIGLNPLHTLYPADAEKASPYSPSSREWLNILYIDVAALEDFQASKAAQRWWQQETTQQRLEQVRGSDWVDYRKVTQLKLTGLRLAFEQFQSRKNSDPLNRVFNQFIEQGGNTLYHQGVFDALHQHLVQQDSRYLAGWPSWPEQYQQIDSPAVADFIRHNAESISFYLWLQWQASRQLAACFANSQEQGMSIGLYRDLAVGVGEGGAATWCDPALYCLQASVGAPPDPLAVQGQNWGLPPLRPQQIIARGYQPFIDLLRANMVSCGALRLDHVMSLLRLWWVPATESAVEGAYVHYPVDELLAILALESQRHQCMVIGEDLGIVPPEIVSKLADAGVYSYKVLYFEHDAQHQLFSPADYKPQALATLTTHDLPTLRGYWQQDDLALGQKLALYPSEQVAQRLVTERQLDKQGLLDALHRTGNIAKKIAKTASGLPMSSALNQGVHYYLAESASALLGLQIEDWLDMALPVNVPGTREQYPNWRRKLSLPIEQIFADNRINLLLKQIDKRRKAQ